MVRIISSTILLLAFGTTTAIQQTSTTKSESEDALRHRALYGDSQSERFDNVLLAQWSSKSDAGSDCTSASSQLLVDTRPRCENPNWETRSPDKMPVWALSGGATRAMVVDLGVFRALKSLVAPSAAAKRQFWPQKVFAVSGATWFTMLFALAKKNGKTLSHTQLLEGEDPEDFCGVLAESEKLPNDWFHQTWRTAQRITSYLPIPFSTWIVANLAGVGNESKRFDKCTHILSSAYSWQAKGATLGMCVGFGSWSAAGWADKVGRALHKSLLRRSW